MNELNASQIGHGGSRATGGSVGSVGRTTNGGRARRQWRSDGGAEVAGQNASRGSVSGRLADQAGAQVAAALGEKNTWYR